MTTHTRPDTERFFENFLKIETRVPNAVWQVLRIVMLAFILIVSVGLFFSPERSLPIFWGILVPILPLLLVIAPGLWRQVCPMAFANQIPRMFGFSKNRDLPMALKSRAFTVAVVLFAGFVFLRAPLLNHSGQILGLSLPSAIVLAFVGGVVFKGRSGWCGTFCPLGPIQRSYGQAPLVVVRNGFCSSCVGCQKNCYDFNPRAAVFSDVFDDDAIYASQRRLFMGLLPGLIFGFFVLGTAVPQNLISYWASLGIFCAASMGLYSLAISFLSVDPYRASLAFSALALAIFYWFSGPTLVHAIFSVLNLDPVMGIDNGARFIGILAACGLGFSGWRSERKYLEQRKAENTPRFDAGIKELTRLPRSGLKPEATDRETGATIPVPDGSSLLDAVLAAGLKLNYGCKSGFCGADAVAIIDGANNLSPPGEDELATLRRLGLEGRARLACVCQVKGPVTLDRNPRAGGEISSTQIRRAKLSDKAKELGLRRVVIVGNGVAGSTVAQALRRESPSVEITIVTNEAAHFYNRMAVGRLIYDATGVDALQLAPDTWFSENNVKVLRNTVATSIDRKAKKIRLATGQVLEYDRLVLATGARPAQPAPDYLKRSNAFVLRNVDDAQAIRAYAQSAGARRAVVIGGGVLGVEAAEAISHLGLQVRLFQRADRIMNAQLDESGSAVLERYLENTGIHCVTGVSVDKFEGDSTISTAWLSHGPRVSADIYVACLGIQPNLLLAKNAGLETARGIKVSHAMQTSDSDIFAVGDVAEPTGIPMSGLWPFAANQAEVAVAKLLGAEPKLESAVTLMRLKSDGIDVLSFGKVPKPSDTQWTAQDGADAWWSLVLRDGKPTGGVFVGPPGSGKSFAKLAQNDASDAALDELLTGGKRKN